MKDYLVAGLFFLLVPLTFYGVWLLEPCIVYTCVLAFLIWILPGKTPLQIYCGNLWLLLDQAWQVVWAPVLNLIMQPRGNCMFGWPDETASSVVGKNYHHAKCFKYVDKVLTFFDRKSKGSHGLGSIERDEYSNFK